MQEQVLQRIDALINEGQKLIRGRDLGDYWVHDIEVVQGWMSSAANAIFQLAPPSSFYRSEVERLTNHEQLKGGIPIHIVQKLFGVLSSVREEAKNGLLEKLEYQAFATAFDDFIDHAAEFHRSGKAKEAAVLAAVVLEDTLKRIARKNGIDPSNKSLEPLIDELMKAEVFTQVKAKRIKAYSGVRNPALHAEWDKIDIRDVGGLIEGTRELIDTFF